MSERKIIAKDGEKEAKTGRGIKTNLPNVHPILQLQQLVGNRTVTNMIQRHSPEIMNRFGFRVKDIQSGEEAWLGSGAGVISPEALHEEQHAVSEQHERRHQAEEVHEQLHQD